MNKMMTKGHIARHVTEVVKQVTSIFALALVPTLTFAQAPKPAAPAGAAATAPLAPAAPPAQASQEPAVRVERGADGKKIYKITTEIKIEGKIQKPEAFYVLQKSSINYEWTELKQDFLPKILDSVSKSPF
jgi:hypothetical protein